MGYSIEYVLIKKIKGEYFYEVVEEGYFTYNFSIYNDQKTGKMLWYFKKDVNGLHSEQVLQRLDILFKKMDEDEIKVGIPDLLNGNWAWGKTMKDKDLSYKERMGVMRFHLTSIMKILKENPNCYVKTDRGGVMHLNDGTEIDMDDLKEIDMENYDEKFVTYFRHPLKGNYKVDTYRKAMEIYGLLASQNNSDADMWFDVAFKMDGAPTRP